MVPTHTGPSFSLLNNVNKGSTLHALNFFHSKFSHSSRCLCLFLSPSLAMLTLLLRRHHRHHHPLLRLLHHNHHSPSHPQPLHLPLFHPTYIIWSANTSLGKTLVSAGLSSSFLLSSSNTDNNNNNNNNNDQSNKKMVYLKPVQTGFPLDSDSRFVVTKLHSLFLRHRHLLHFPPSLCLSDSILFSSLSAAKSFLSSKNLQLELKESNSGMFELNFCQEESVFGEDNNNNKSIVSSELVCKTLFAWEEAVSPHLAAERESGVVKDCEVVEVLARCLRNELESERGKMEILCVVETAGGVASPGPSGSLQCDLYRQVIFLRT